MTPVAHFFNRLDVYEMASCHAVSTRKPVLLSSPKRVRERVDAGIFEGAQCREGVVATKQCLSSVPLFDTINRIFEIGH